MRWDEITLVNSGSGKTKYLRLALQGTHLTRETWTDAGGRVRSSGRGYETADAAREAADRELRKGMRNGFVYLRDRDTAGLGGIVLWCMPRNRFGSQAFDAPGRAPGRARDD